MDFYYYTIEIDTDLETITSDPLSVFHKFKNNTALLLIGFENDGEKNFDRIIETYSSADLISQAAKIVSRQLTLIKAGTVLMLPKSDLEVELVALTNRNLFVKNISSFNTFYGSYLELLHRDGFTPAFRNSDEINDVDIREYQISVWVWSRTYSQNGTTLLDITKYIENCSTSVNGSSNSFSISLLAVDSKGIDVGDEVINRINIDDSITNWSVSDFISPSIKISERLPVPWFKKILQQNDIFFIRFEQLAFEKTEDRKVGEGVELSSSNLPGKVFDMIGLVDSVSSRFNPTTTEITIDVSGRDMTKLLIEDGSYFFPLLFTENSDTLFFNTQDDSKWFKRTFVKNTFDYLFLYKMQSIRDSLSFMINQLTNLGVCNDELFSSYDDVGEGDKVNSAGQRKRRTRTLQLTGTKKDQITWNVVSGIWQIVDILVDEQIDDRRIANSQISNPNGNLLSVVESFCQRPFVEFFGDTYGDKFVFIARTPPFTKAAILSVLNSLDFIDVNLRDVEEYDLTGDTTFYTWFEMDPRNMFLGRSDSIALAYLPVVYFPEIAETFGNKQMKITDNYISNRAFTGNALTENRDEFKQKAIEDFLYIIESYCNLPFTEIGTITLKRDRRIKAKTWVKIGSQFFYVESVTNSFFASGELVDGLTILSVSRGMYIDFIRGKMVAELGRVVDYWSIIKLDTIRSVLIQKLRIFNSEADALTAGSTGVGETKITKNTVKVSFGTDKDVFDYFLQRKFL